MRASTAFHSLLEGYAAKNIACIPSSFNLVRSFHESDDAENGIGCILSEMLYEKNYQPGRGQSWAFCTLGRVDSRNQRQNYTNFHWISELGNTTVGTELSMQQLCAKLHEYATEAKFEKIVLAIWKEGVDRPLPLPPGTATPTGACLYMCVHMYVMMQMYSMMHMYIMIHMYIMMYINMMIHMCIMMHTCMMMIVR
jgi:hypothetical protein